MTLLFQGKEFGEAFGEEYGSQYWMWTGQTLRASPQCPQILSHSKNRPLDYRITLQSAAKTTLIWQVWDPAATPWTIC